LNGFRVKLFTLKGRNTRQQKEDLVVLTSFGAMINDVVHGARFTLGWGKFVVEHGARFADRALNIFSTSKSHITTKYHHCRQDSCTSQTTTTSTTTTTTTNPD